MQKHVLVNLVDLVKSFPTNIFLQNLASIQKRTSPIQSDHLAEKSEKGSISNLSTKVEIDDDHAALIRDKRTGALRLETKKQLYFPGPDEVIEEVRELIKLADHEAVIMKHKDGHYTFHYGAEDKRKPGESRSFFLPPHAELVTMWWSAELKVSIGEGSNHSNYSDQSSVRILSKFRNFR